MLAAMSATLRFMKSTSSVIGDCPLVSVVRIEEDRQSGTLSKGHTVGTIRSIRGSQKSQVLHPIHALTSDVTVHGCVRF